MLAAAVIRLSWLPEAAVAVPAAALLIGTGALPAARARGETARLLPVLGFLAAVLVLGRLCEEEGLFTAAGARLAAASKGSPRRLLAGVFLLSSLTTAVLSLDTTVVLLTPVVYETTGRLGVPRKPHLYACAHLANSASLLLPVSNLTNLLALGAAGVSLVRFGALMALPWLAVIAVEYAAFRFFFAADLAAAVPVPAPRTAPRDGPQAAAGAVSAVPLFPVLTVAVTLAGFAAASLAGASPAWAALGGAGVLAVRGLIRGTTSPASLLRALSLPFLAFVLGLGLVVTALVAGGLGSAVPRVLPGGSSLAALLALAAVAAVLANLVNNLPAVLVLVAALSGGPAGQVLAVLIGVNIGPNLTYTGSLATLLWRRMMRERGMDASLGEFTRLGLLTGPAGIAAATVALWAALRVAG